MTKKTFIEVVRSGLCFALVVGGAACGSKEPSGDGDTEPASSALSMADGSWAGTWVVPPDPSTNPREVPITIQEAENNKISGTLDLGSGVTVSFEGSVDADGKTARGSWTALGSPVADNPNACLRGDVLFTLGDDNTLSTHWWCTSMNLAGTPNGTATATRR
ncbi:hypothetical protein [Polyangium sp. y55x31]|uniref:hypothetical protein n=1 Tax=Polyangium sp. y55x31 TaxID=3042688 RepID=UPI002482C032|nr:hypothetical protein [Polyangium sp. y55x31]MDI1475969.1 hypothetical protein [Polyangium sp. y55x31]